MRTKAVVGKLYRASLADVVSAVRKRAGIRAPDHVDAPALTVEFLRSREYDDLMSRHLPCDGAYDLHEAQNQTVNYRFRHHEAAGRLGAFRWRGMQRHKERMLSLLASPSARVLDFGGAAGPLGLGSTVVDLAERDRRGRPVMLHSLTEVKEPADVIFSSHALEHVPNLAAVLSEMKQALRPGGTLIAHVPSYFCERWRAGVHSSQPYKDHVWTFGLEDKPAASGLSSYANIAGLVSRSFSVDVAEYCGDDSIMVIARS